MKTRRPAWRVLYSLLPIAATLLAVVGWWIPAGAGRVFAEATVSFVILGGIALWVHANRVVLTLGNAREETETPVRAWVAYRPSAPRGRSRVSSASDSGSQLAA